MSVLRLNEFNALPGQFEALVAAFEAIIPIIRDCDGCERCELLLKVADGNTNDDRLIILEVWRDVAAHQNAAKAVPPEQFQTIMALLSGPPKGQYYTALPT